MRRTTLIGLALCGLVSNVGCGGKPPPVVPVPPPAGVNPPPTPVSPTKSTGEQATMLETLLAAVNQAEGTTIANLSTPDLRKLQAPPKEGFSDDQAAGYAVPDYLRWINRQFSGAKAVKVDAVIAAPEARVVLVRGTLDGPSTTRFAARLVKHAGPPHWLLDQLVVAPGALPALPASTGEPAFAAASAGLFLDALLADEVRSVAGSLAVEYRQSVAPPFASDKLGYHESTLAKWLRDQRGSFTGYTLSKADASANGVVVTGTLTDGKSPTPFTLTIAKGKDGYTVTAFQTGTK
jgi:hypothetical protein